MKTIASWCLALVWGLTCAVMGGGVSEFQASGWSANGSAELHFTPSANCPEVRGTGAGKGFGGLIYTPKTPVDLTAAQTHDFIVMEIYQNFSRGVNVQLRTDRGMVYRHVKLPRERWSIVRLPLDFKVWKGAKPGAAWGKLQSVVVYNGQCRNPGQRIFIREVSVNCGGKAVLNFQAPAPKAAKNIVNYGVGGANSHGVNRYVLRKVLAQPPTLAIVMVGTNDMINTHKMATPEQYEKNLSAIVTRLQKFGAKVILMTIPPCQEALVLKRHNPKKFGAVTPQQRIVLANKIVRQVAASKHCNLVDFHAIIVADPAKYLRTPQNSGVVDGVHPTAEAYRLLAQALAKEIKTGKLPTARIACIGDSITFGAGMFGAGTAQGECYPGVLAELLND